MKNKKSNAYKLGVEYLAFFLSVIDIISLEIPDIRRRLLYFWGKKYLIDLSLFCMYAAEVLCDAKQYIESLKWLRRQIVDKLYQGNPKFDIFDDIDTILESLLSKEEITILKALLEDKTQINKNV